MNLRPVPNNNTGDEYSSEQLYQSRVKQQQKVKNNEFLHVGYQSARGPPRNNGSQDQFNGAYSARGPQNNLSSGNRVPYQQKNVKQSLGQKDQNSWGVAPQQKPQQFQYEDDNSYELHNESISQPINGNVIPLGEKQASGAASRVSNSQPQGAPPEEQDSFYNKVQKTQVTKMKSPKQEVIMQKDLKVEDILMKADYKQQSIISEALESQENTHTQTNRPRSNLGKSGIKSFNPDTSNIDDQQPLKKQPKKMVDQRQSLPLQLSSEFNIKEPPHTTRGPSEVDGYAISFNEKEQLKYKGLITNAQQVQKPKSLRNDSIGPEEQISQLNPGIMFSDQKEMRNRIIKKKPSTKKKVDFLSLNKKYINGRPKSKKFGLIDTKTLENKRNNFNSTDNLLLNNMVDNMKKKVKKTKKKSIKPDLQQDQVQEFFRRAREQEEDKKKRMADVTPPANLYAVNINVMKENKAEIKMMEVVPKKTEIKRISSPPIEEKPKSEIHRISSQTRDEAMKSPQDLKQNESIHEQQYDDFNKMLQNQKDQVINVERVSLKSNGNRQDPNLCRGPRVAEGSLGRTSIGSLSREKANDSIQPQQLYFTPLPAAPAQKRNIKKIVPIPMEYEEPTPDYHELKVNHQLKMSQLMKKMKDYVDNSNSKFRYQESTISSLKQENNILQQRNERLQAQIKQLIAAQKYVAPTPVAPVSPVVYPKREVYEYQPPAPVEKYSYRQPNSHQQSIVEYQPPRPQIKYDSKVDHPIPRSGQPQPLLKVRSQGWIPPQTLQQKHRSMASLQFN